MVSVSIRSLPWTTMRWTTPLSGTTGPGAAGVGLVAGGGGWTVDAGGGGAACAHTPEASADVASSMASPDTARTDARGRRAVERSIVRAIGKGRVLTRTGRRGSEIRYCAAGRW